MEDSIVAEYRHNQCSIINSSEYTDLTSRIKSLIFEYVQDTEVVDSLSLLITTLITASKVNVGLENDVIDLLTKNIAVDNSFRTKLIAILHDERW